MTEEHVPRMLKIYGDMIMNVTTMLMNLTKMLLVVTFLQVATLLYLIWAK